VDHDRRTDALGLLILALLLLTVTARSPVPPAVAPPAAPADVRARVGLGWPIPADCPDPTAWDVLPGIGPTRAARLAEAASAGALRAPDDLLRVRGIGTKMARALQPHIEFPAREATP